MCEGVGQLGGEVCQPRQDRIIYYTYPQFQHDECCVVLCVCCRVSFPRFTLHTHGGANLCLMPTCPPTYASVCLSVFLSVCLCVCCTPDPFLQPLPVCLSVVSMSIVYLYVCDGETCTLATSHFSPHVCVCVCVCVSGVYVYRVCWPLHPSSICPSIHPSISVCLSVCLTD